MEEEMPAKKKRRVTPANHWSTLSSVSKSNAKLSTQQEQYYALLKQLGEVVDQQWTGPDQVVEMTDHITTWITTVTAQAETVTLLRNEALQSMRQADVLDNDALTLAAAKLTDNECQLVAYKNVLERFSRIVRYKEGGLVQHTTKWLQRFCTQWETSNNVFNQNILQIRESCQWLTASFPQLLLPQTSATTHS